MAYLVSTLSCVVEAALVGNSYRVSDATGSMDLPLWPTSCFVALVHASFVNFVFGLCLVQSVAKYVFFDNRIRG